MQYLKQCPKPIGTFTNRRTGQEHPLGCGRWDCPHCGIIKKNRLADRIASGFSPAQTAGQRIRMITLTQRLGSERNIMQDWGRFRALLAKRGIKLNYFWSKEFTKKGQRHLHVIVNAYIPHVVIKECWRKATQGESFIVYATGSKHEGATGDIYAPAGYATKYITKAFGDTVRFEPKERRFGFSRNPLFKPVKYEIHKPFRDECILLGKLYSFHEPLYKVEIEYMGSRYHGLPATYPAITRFWDNIIRPEPAGWKCQNWAP